MRQTTLIILLAAIATALRAQPIQAKFERISLQGLSQTPIMDIFQDRRGFMWFGTANGLYRFDGNSFNTYEYSAADKNSLNGSIVSVIYEDRSGMLWIGTTDGGLNRFDPATNQFTHYLHQPSDSNSLSGNNVTAVYEDRAGMLWVGCSLAGLNRLDRATGKVTRYQHQPDNPNSLSSNSVMAVHTNIFFSSRWTGSIRIRRYLCFLY